MTTTDTEIAAVHRAQLRDMPLEAIVSFLMEDKGFSVTLRKPGYTVWAGEDEGERAVRFAQLLNQGMPGLPSLPPGYPPYADDDALPFEEKPPTQSGRRLRGS